MTFRPFSPKRRKWARGFLIAMSLAAGLYGLVSWRWFWTPGGAWGLVYGSLAALIFLKEGLYPLRRRWMARPFGSAQNWLQLHIYGGVAASLLVVLHMGVRWPAGTFGWLLLGLTLYASFSGLMGVAIQKWIPALIARQLRVEAPLQRIPDLIARLTPEAEEIVKGASRYLSDFHDQKIRAVLRAPLSWRTALAGVAGRARIPDTEFRALEVLLSPEEKLRLDDIRAIVGEKLELELQYCLQRLMRLWLWFHVPPSYALLALVLWHIATVWYY